MLVTSIFSFSHNIFKRLLSRGRQKSELCGKELNLVCTFCIFLKCIIALVIYHFIFFLWYEGIFISSPEHNVHRMSYCDRSMSGVCLSVRPWTITLKIFSSETGQQISIKLHRNDPLVMHFQKTSKIWIPWRTLVAMATERKKSLKIFLSQTVRARAFIFGM